MKTYGEELNVLLASDLDDNALRVAAKGVYTLYASGVDDNKGLTDPAMALTSDDKATIGLIEMHGKTPRQIIIATALWFNDVRPLQLAVRVRNLLVGDHEQLALCWDHPMTVNGLYRDMCVCIDDTGVLNYGVVFTAGAEHEFETTTHRTWALNMQRIAAKQVETRASIEPRYIQIPSSTMASVLPPTYDILDQVKQNIKLKLDDGTKFTISVGDDKVFLRSSINRDWELRINSSGYGAVYNWRYHGSDDAIVTMDSAYAIRLIRIAASFLPAIGMLAAL